MIIELKTKTLLISKSKNYQPHANATNTYLKRADFHSYRFQ